MQQTFFVHETFSLFCIIFIEFVPQSEIMQSKDIGVGKAVMVGSH
jgi:hypothetical protein